VAAAPAVFGALATVCAQLAQTRRLATGLGVGVFGVFFVLRMIGDSGTGAAWLLWATPLGWIEKVEPFTTNDVWPLLPALLVTVGAGALAVAMAARRDAGAGAIASHEVRPLRTRGLSSPFGLATRLNLPVLVAWTVGVASTAFLMGIVTKSVASALDGSSSMANALTELGASTTASAALQYLGTVFLLTGGVLALVPASQIGPAREEEASGRLSMVLAGRPTRVAWLGGRLVLGAVAIALIGLLAGVAGWLGAASQGLTLDFGTMLAAGVNIVPAALLALGVGALAFAVIPRFATIVVYAVVGWSLIIDLLGSLITGLDGLTRASIFHYVALAPSTTPDWTALAVMTVLALLLCATAVALFARRDVSPD
jgi:ABC-2 type transport system permease protein